jgi:hypothetical protein
MVHFPGFARTRLWIHRAVRGVYPRGFPHSEIPGSKPACGSPGLIAACHVLHRLLLPRHPPCALSSLTTKFARCTRAFGYWFLAFSWKHEHAEKFYGPYILLIACSRLATPTPQQETIQALIKIYVRLVIAQSIQLSKIVLADLHQQTPLQRVWVLLIPESCKLQIASNPMFDANFIDAQRQVGNIGKSEHR